VDSVDAAATAMQKIATGSLSDSMREVARLGDVLLANGAVCVVVTADDRGRVVGWGACGSATRIATACAGLGGRDGAWFLSQQGSGMIADLARQPLGGFGTVPAALGLRSCSRYPVTVDGRPEGNVLVFRPATGEPSDRERSSIRLVVSAAAAAFARASLDRRVAALEHRRQEALKIGLRASEHVRSQLAADLHDGPVQVIAAALMCLDRAARSPDPERLDLIHHARDTIALTMERARRLIFDLNPDVLRSSGLAAAIDDLAILSHRESGVDVHVDVCPRRYPDDVETIAYRTVSEALANIRKHAQACRVQIAIRTDGDALDGRVWDDGCGFDTSRYGDSRSAAGHLGFRSMRERLAAAGGLLAVKSSPGCGTTVRFRLPLDTCDLAA
jgi:signal transduction histidine kinase